MVVIEKFVFNSFQENTFLVYDDTKECVIVDPGCYDAGEQAQFERYISMQGLKPVCLVNTHCHIDHILGNNFIFKQYQLRPNIHEAGLTFLREGHIHSKIYGYQTDPFEEPEGFVEEGDVIRFGQSGMEVLYTPGHADGSICLVSSEGGFVITGDVLFRGSIGRTDFPTGDFDLLIGSIREKLFTLDGGYVVYPGHGHKTSIGYEMKTNPFLR